MLFIYLHLLSIGCMWLPRNGPSLFLEVAAPGGRAILVVRVCATAHLPNGVVLGGLAKRDGA